MSNVEQTASRLARFGEVGGGAPGTAYLLVVLGDSSSIFHLPRSGAIVMGRGTDVELRLDHASVSRRHATIRVDDGVPRIADLGSHNGTRVNGERIAEARALASGDVATVGDVVLVVHFSAPAVVGRATCAEDAWRRRLVEELTRSITFDRPLAVAALADAGGAGGLAAVAGALRLIDVVGIGDDGQLLLLLPECDRALARQLLGRVLAAAPASRAGLAVCPTDACDLDSIILTARAAARRATPGRHAEVGDVATRLDLGTRQVTLADPAMVRVYGLLERLAASALPVLINGETGVGKENAAYAVHHWSRRPGPFVAVNCAALGPDSLIESELFGHDKGAFTGATAVKVGLFEGAAGGTVFLDEVGELPLAIQAKLLRTLEQRVITRLGEQRERPIDVRVVAATNRDLDAEVVAGRFRRDLFYRLSGATVILPPLRDRRCEIPVLAAAFLTEACARAGKAAMTLSPATMQVLLTHDWAGNIRELRNTIDYVVAASPDDTVEPYDLPERLGGSSAAGSGSGTTSPSMAALVLPPPEPAPGGFRPIADELRELERRRMSEALAAAGGVKTRAAAMIDMPIRTFTLKLKQHKL
jgi:DNA-binding NtrC family response regulator